MLKQVSIVFLAGLVAGTVACGDSGPGTDAGADAGSGDMGTPDSGRPVAFCPSAAANATCQRASDCQDDTAPPPKCANFCLPENNQLCVYECQTPELGEVSDIHSVQFDVRGIVTTNLKSFGGMAFAAETAGGQILTCDDFYQGTIDYRDACVNNLQSRGLGAQDAETGTSFLMSFNRLPVSQDILFVIWGFETDDPMGTPLGVMCVKATSGPNGGGPLPIAGDTMRPIQ